MTPQEFSDRLGLTAGSKKLPNGAEIVELSFTPESEAQMAFVYCKLTASTKDMALAGAESVLAIVDGLETYVRVAPEADTVVDATTNDTVHTGYVRFGFRDRSGIRATLKADDRTLRYASLAQLI